MAQIHLKDSTELDSDQMNIDVNDSCTIKELANSQLIRLKEQFKYISLTGENNIWI